MRMLWAQTRASRVCESRQFFNAPTRNRTENLLIKSQLLYQLSYRRVGGETSSGETRYASYATPVTSAKPVSHSAPIRLVGGGASRQAIGNVR